MTHGKDTWTEEMYNMLARAFREHKMNTKAIKEIYFLNVPQKILWNKLNSNTFKNFLKKSHPTLYPGGASPRSISATHTLQATWLNHVGVMLPTSTKPWSMSTRPDATGTSAPTRSERTETQRCAFTGKFTGLTFHILVGSARACDALGHGYAPCGACGYALGVLRM